MENTHLIGIDDLGLTYLCTDLTELDELFSNLRRAGLSAGVMFEESFTVNNDTNHVRFGFTNSHSEDDVESLLDVFDNDRTQHELSNADLSDANWCGADLTDAYLTSSKPSAKV